MQLSRLNGCNDTEIIHFSLFLFKIRLSDTMRFKMKMIHNTLVSTMFILQ